MPPSGGPACLAHLVSYPICNALQRPSAPLSVFLWQSVGLELIMPWVLHPPQKFISLGVLKYAHRRKVSKRWEAYQVAFAV